MSGKITSPNFQGLNRRFYDLPTNLAPFEVMNVGNGKVAINEGVLIMGGTAMDYKRASYTSAAKPVDMTTGGIANEACFLSAQAHDFIVLVIRDYDTSSPKPSLEAVQQSKLWTHDYNRHNNAVVKLAYIRNVIQQNGSSFFEIEQLYNGHVLHAFQNLPAFTPILWPVEKTEVWAEQATEQGDTDKKTEILAWKCIFTPAHLYVANTMEESEVFHVEGTPMTSFPTFEVQAGDEYSICFELDKNWNLKGVPIFTKSQSCDLLPVVPEMCCGVGEFPCTPEDGSYRLRILKFVAGGDNGLEVEQYWRSDISIHGWGISKCSDDGDGSSGGSSSGGGSDSGSDKSTAIVKAAWSPTDYAALFVLESPEVRFEDVISVNLQRASCAVGIDPKFVSVCEENSISVVGYTCDKPISLGFKVVGGVIHINKSLLAFIYPNVNLKIHISGIRKNHANKRFPSRTKKQYDENEAFLNSAYSKS